MGSYDQTNGACHVYSFKDGLLSRVAHDLKLEVRTFRVEVGKRTLAGTFDAASLRVVCARRDSMDAPDALSEGDRRKIEENMARDVLATRSYPLITFQSTSVDPTANGATVMGQLTLVGQRHPIRLAIARETPRVRAIATVTQPDFGIKPFSAMLGAIKIRPDVRIEIDLIERAMDELLAD